MKKQEPKSPTCMRMLLTNGRDYQHKLSRKLVDEHGAIYLEDLNEAGMVKNHHLAKGISDAVCG